MEIHMPYENFIADILQILAEEIIPAEGCTEPIAIAYASSLAADYLGTAPEKINIFLSGNMIKNVKSVHIPNAEGRVGIEFAVGMGALLGQSKSKLMVIADVDKSRLPEVEEYVSKTNINVLLEKDCPKLYIRIEACAAGHSVLVEIKDFHTNVTRLELDGKSVLDGQDAGCAEKPASDSIRESYTDRSFLTIDLICEAARNIDLGLIEPLFNDVIAKNTAIAQEGLRNVYGIAIGKTIQDGIKEGLYGNDLRNNLAAFAAAGSDARMNGCPLPVMTTSGSGNQGMTCSLPIIRFCQMKGLSHEDMIRGLFVSHLSTIHIKESIGRLSAYCGAMAASAAVSGAMAFLDKLGTDKVKMAIETTLATVSGVICDGAKSSCATKICTGITMAVDSYFAARCNRGLSYGEGIVGEDVETTIDHVGTLGNDGMQVTDNVILDIMMQSIN